MVVRIEKMVVTVLRKAHGWEVEEAMDTLAQETEGFYRSQLN
jgi:hypothetical protein